MISQLTVNIIKPMEEAEFRENYGKKVKDKRHHEQEGQTDRKYIDESSVKL